MMKDRFANPIVHYGILTAIYGLALATILFHTVSHAMVDKTDTCERVGKLYSIKVTPDNLEPTRIDLKRCDRLMFRAADSRSHILAFGPHSNHTKYAGETEIIVKPQESKTIILSQTGEYLIHDHLNETKKVQINIVDFNQ